MNNLKVLSSIYDTYRYARQNDSRMADKLIEYYNEGKSNPSVAKIIKNDGTDKYYDSYSTMIIDDVSHGKIQKNAIDEFNKNTNTMINNVFKLNNSSKVAPYKQAFDKQMTSLYPKTQFLRDSIIAHNRISFFEDKPKPKAGLFDKLKIKLFAALKKGSLKLNKNK